MKIWNKGAIFELLGKQANGNFVSLYVGPWNNMMEAQIAYSSTVYFGRLIRRYVKHYVSPGDGQPNRRVDPEIASAVRRRVFPFDVRAESFYPEGFVFEPAEAVDKEAA